MCRLRAISLIVVLVPWLSFAAETEEFKGKVVSIADGDTITVLRDKEQVKVRLEGIDCPEKGQSFGTKAKEFTGDQAFGKEVTIKSKGKDRYGRTLGEVILPDGKSLNRELLKAGFAWHYKQFNKEKELADLEDEARKAKVGLWTDADPVPPWEWRKKNKK